MMLFYRDAWNADGV